MPKNNPGNKYAPVIKKKGSLPFLLEPFSQFLKALFTMHHFNNCVPTVIEFTIFLRLLKNGHLTSLDIHYPIN